MEEPEEPEEPEVLAAEDAEEFVKAGTIYTLEQIKTGAVNDKIDCKQKEVMPAYVCYAHL